MNIQYIQCDMVLYVTLTYNMDLFLTNMYDSGPKEFFRIMTVLHGSNSSSKLFHPQAFGADRTLLKHRVLRRWNERRPVFLAVLSFRDNLCLHTTKKTETSICSTFTQWVERLEFILWRRFLSEHVGITVLVLHVSALPECHCCFWWL